MTLLDKLLEIVKRDETNWSAFQKIFIKKEIASKTVLLHEGEIADKIYFIENGCLREWFNKDGKDITFQFFFEGQPVAAIDSFFSNKPSMFNWGLSTRAICLGENLFFFISTVQNLLFYSIFKLSVLYGSLQFNFGWWKFK